MVVNVTATTDALGGLFYYLMLPSTGALIGLRVAMQAAVLDSGGSLFGVAALSNGVEITIGP